MAKDLKQEHSSRSRNRSAWDIESAARRSPLRDDGGPYHCDGEGRYGGPPCAGYPQRECH